jgi:hypothetical protein
MTLSVTPQPPRDITWWESWKVLQVFLDPLYDLLGPVAGDDFLDKLPY